MGSTGPISYREVMAYANEMELGPNSQEFLWEVVRRVDGKFLKLISGKLEEERQKTAAAIAKAKGQARG